MQNKSLNILTKEFEKALEDFVNQYNYLPISTVALVFDRMNIEIQNAYNTIVKQEVEQCEKGEKDELS